MPRKLPWMMQGESALISSPKRHVISSTPPQKRVKVSEIGSNGDSEEAPLPTREPEPQGRDEHKPQSSPPSEHLPERFMHEGIEHDDNYRMVEDEFLATAQQFTIHLHAAEYKKQEKMTRARNAETINSISRPVTEKMSGYTKHKVDGIARSKMQQDTIQSLLGSKTDSEEDSSDGEGLAYFNATLCGLMDSPRRKEASLSKLPYTVATRAAAGFQKPASLNEQNLSHALESPKPKSSLRGGQPLKSDQSSSTDSSGIDDDLDASVPVSRFPSLNKRRHPTPSSSSVLQARVAHPSPSNEQNLAARKPPSSMDENSSTSNSAPPKAVQASSNDAALLVRRRLLRARLEETKKENENENKKDLDLIPTFL